MKHYGRPARTLTARHGFGLHRLPRSERRDGHLVKIIFRPAIRQLATLVLLQEQGVQSIMVDGAPLRGIAVETHDRDQRMQSRHAIVVVETLYCVEINIFHCLIFLGS